MTDILDPNYESDLTEEEHDQLVLMSEHAVAPPLSPATQSVLNAFIGENTIYGLHLMAPKLAAALRAAADQVVPESCFESDDVIRDKFLAIAAELEGAQ